MKDNRLYVGKEMYIGLRAVIDGVKFVVTSDSCPIVELTEDKMVIHVKGTDSEEFIPFYLNTFDGVCYREDDPDFPDMIHVASDDHDEVHAIVSA